MLTENPYAAMISRFMPQRFYGREELIGAITSGVTAPEPRSYAILGTPKIGKTALLWYLRADQGALSNPLYRDSIMSDYLPGGPRHLLFVYISFRNERQPRILAMLLKHLRLAINEGKAENSPFGNDKTQWPVTQWPIKDAELNRKKPSELLNELKATLDELDTQRQRVVFLLDDFGDALDDDDTQGLSSNAIADIAEEERAMRSLANRAAFVITLEHDQSDALDSSFLLSLWNNALGLLDRKAALALVEDPTKDLIHQPGRHITKREAEYLLWLAGRQPFLLTLVCAEYLSYQEQYPSARLVNTLAEPLLEKAEHREDKQFTSYLLSKTQINRTLTLLWNEKLPPDEREALYLLAEGRTEEEIERRQPGRAMQLVNALRERSLVFIQDGKACVLSELFRRYVLDAYPRSAQRPQLSLADMKKHVADELGPIDRQVFEELTSREGDVYHYESLREQVWGDPKTPHRALTASINRIRRTLGKVDTSGRAYIENERNKGYSFKFRS